MSYSFKAEKLEQLLVKRLIKEGMIVFDVGANDGDYSILFSQLAGAEGKVYSFEPTPEVFEILKQRLKEFNCENVCSINKAVFGEDGIAEFQGFEGKYHRWNTLGKNPVMRNPEDPSHGLLPVTKTMLVETISLDSFCEERRIKHIDYLKVDVEGAETEVMKGASNLLSARAISFVQFEVSALPLKGMGHHAKEIFDILMHYGYQCHRIQEEGQIGEQVYNSDSFYENYIAFPSLPKEYSHYNKIIGSFHFKIQQQKEMLENQKEMLENQKEMLENQKEMLEKREAVLQSLTATLEQVRSKNKKLKESRQRLKVKLKTLSFQLMEERKRVVEMESSKFWKVRKMWLKAKKLLRLY